MDRTRQCRPKSRAAGLSRPSSSHNRTWRLVLAGCGLALLASSTAGCSLSFPLAGFKGDDAPTGSIDRSASLLSPELDREDWRRARAALSVALDPQGNGGAVNWRNPQTGARGSFVAPAPPFVERDHICRGFVAEVSPPSGPGRHLTGSACREGDGNWALREASDGRKV